MPVKEKTLTEKLRSVYENIGDDLPREHYNQGYSLVLMLTNQNHSCESIACHMQLRGLFYGYVPTLADALFDNKISNH